MGVAGLQAIATARRLGAVASAYDVRPAVREEVESLGGKFVELELETAEAAAQTGYAKALAAAGFDAVLIHSGTPKKRSAFEQACGWEDRLTLLKEPACCNRHPERGLTDHPHLCDNAPTADA